MADPAILARVRTIPSKSKPPKHTKPSPSRPSSSRQTKPRQPSTPRTTRSPAKPRQPPKPRQPRQPRQPKLPKPPPKPTQPSKPRQPRAQAKPSKSILTDQPTVATSSDHITARPLLASRFPPPPEVPVFASEPSPSSSTPLPPTNQIDMEDEEYSSRMLANQRAEQQCALQIQQTGRYATPEYPFPELKDPSYRSRIVLKPTVHDVQPISARPPSPQPDRPFLPPRPLPPSRPLQPPPKPALSLTYRKKSVHKPSSPSTPPPS